MWTWVATDRLPIPGIVAQDYEDTEFDTLEAEYEEGFPGVEPGVLKRSGLWEHVVPGAVPGPPAKAQEAKP